MPARLRRMIRPLAAVLVFPALAACQTGRAYVLEPAQPDARFTSIALREGRSTAPLSEHYRAHFEQALAGMLERDAGFATRHDDPADTLTIEYRQVLNDAGSSGVRVGAAIVSVVGVPTGALGQGQLAVEATYRDPHGRVLGKIVADGPIDGPAGSTRNGLSTAAKTIARFAKENFHATAPDATANLGAFRSAGMP